MATFADFALLRAEPSYGGAEVLRAQRVHDGGAAEPVHLALFGEMKADGARERAGRLARVAAAAAQTGHEQVARILEVGVYEGSLYAAAAPAEGVDLSAVLELERRRKAVPDVAFSVAAALLLAQLAADLHERGDVWAAEGASGLSALFPAGLRLDALVLERSGTLRVRILAGAAADPARPTAFRAPEVRTQGASVASDVFVVAQTLRALLTGDATATSAPRFRPAAMPLGPLLATGLTASPDERLGLFMLVERLSEELVRLAGKTTPAGVIASFLKREYRSLIPDDAADAPVEESASTLRPRLAGVRRALQVLWPRVASPPVPELDDGGAPTTVVPAAGREHTESAVGRVFDDGSVEPTVSGRVSAAPGPTGFSDLSETEPPTKTIPMPLDKRLLQVEATSPTEEESDPPWISMSEDFALVEASSAPAPDPGDLEAGPTIQMRPPAGAADDAAADDDTSDTPPATRSRKS